MIYNEHFEKEEDQPIKGKKKLRLVDHELLTASPHTKKFCGEKWDRSAKLKYQQHTCKIFGCSKRIRTYCVCNKGMWMCQHCFSKHIIDMATTAKSGD